MRRAPCRDKRFLDIDYLLAALDTQAAALDRFHIEGIQDNIPFVAAVMDEARFRSGNITTAYIKDEFPDGFSGVEATTAQEAYLVSAALYAHALRARRAGEAQAGNAGDRFQTDWVVILGGKQYPVYFELGKGEAFLKLGKNKHTLVTAWVPGNNLFEGTLDGAAFAVSFHQKKNGLHIRHRGVAKPVTVCSPRLAELYARLPEKEAADMSKLIISPMPGLVVSMDVAVGQEVKAGEGVCVVEAMKMQNIIRAEADGKVRVINVEAGNPVAADEIMVEFE